MARTIFERVPEYFIERYDDEMRNWGRNFQKIGRVKAFILREGVFADPSPDPELGPVLLQVKLRARVTGSERKKVDGLMREVASEVTVCPASDADEQKIRDHCQKMVRFGVPARTPGKVLTELPRAGLPFMPTRYT
jgi:hypothetical protein